MTSEAKPLLEAYLFNGDDELKINTLLEILTKRVADNSDISFNREIFQGRELRISEPLINALNTLPFAGPKRLVVIRDVDAAPKQVQESLVDYLKSPTSTTVLAMTAQALAKNTRLYKAVAARGAQAIVDCSTKKRSELVDLVTRLAKDYGVAMDRSAATALLERTGTPTLNINNELKKLVSIVKAEGKNRVTAQDVAQQVPYMVEPKPWDLTDALALRDIAICLQLLERIVRLSPSGAIDQVFTRLYAQCLTKIREILTVKRLRKRGTSDIPTALKRPEFQLRTSMKGAELFSERELVSILRRAPTTEMRMKSQPDSGLILETWLMDVCKKG